ncbi:MAG TPA: ATP cone domain-containing protein [Candidatus Pacearchaeota archaeon]|jgi:hypothetical protein|nr:ATP cone domain-containing protein [Candidatus Pacearchaeota archaeon]HQG09261.1 ATP cone domain-containing protein [Candidatus Pacearchaeota archaeon]HQH20328.1 ATP cone domain-containing protein [Candidatus Pacearchaeota archaeon]HRR95012.1 ATP cone domain-containing protein [Candidatus Paceibacterota bacterium]
MFQKIKVINALGEEEPFSERKVRRSLRKAGANSKTIERILNNLKSQLYNGISTAEIFKIAKQELKKQEPALAIKFNLKHGIRNLGPDGFSFEKYIREIFEHYGYAVKINQYTPGRCLTYETDLLADDGSIFYFGECKFRHEPGERLNLGVGLKLFATFLDVQDFLQKQVGQNKKIIPLLVTNAKFTNQLIQYSKCQKIKLLGWNYPKGEGLEAILERKKLYPVTILPSFRPYMNNAFGEAQIMLASDLLSMDINKIVQMVKFPTNKISVLVKEAELLLKQGAIIKK